MRTAIEMHSDDIKIEQKSKIIGNVSEHGPEVVEAQQVMPKDDYLAELAFNEEPVKIRLERSADKNAARLFYCCVNGRGGEMLMDNKWYPVTYFPVGIPFITKRKYVAVIVGAKLDNIETDVGDATVEHPRNDIIRRTSSAQVFSVLEDRNPLGAAWLTELMRRNG